MNEVMVFEHEQFGNLRTIEQNGEPWFVGKDVADMLGYSNPRDAIYKHVDDDDKITVAICDGNKGNPNIIIINESGLYSLVLSSKMPNAKKFKHWVTSKVLPSIRKTGSYSTVSSVTRSRLQTDDVMNEWFTNIEALNRLPQLTAILNDFRSLVSDAALTSAINRIMSVPKHCNNTSVPASTSSPAPIESKNSGTRFIDFVNNISSRGACVSAVSPFFGLTAVALNSILDESGVQFKDSNGYRQLCDEYKSKGYDTPAFYFDGSTKKKTNYFRWTADGVWFIHDLLAERGIFVDEPALSAPF